MHKKWLSILLCIVLLLTLSAQSLSALAAAGDKTVFTLSVSEGKVGDTVTVSVSLPENSRFTNATMYLHFNTDALAYVEESVYAGSISPKSNTMYMAMEHRDQGYVKCVYATGSYVKKAGILLNFEFEVLSNIPASFYMTFDECCGANEDDSLFDMNYEVVGCVLNNDGTVEIPTGAPVITTTTVVAPTDSINTQSPQGGDATTVSNGADTTQTTMPTMIVTDEGNNEIIIPVMTTTDTNGNSATVPVVVVTDANGSTVTVPVTVVTDTKGSVATIPFATATDAQGNEVTVPVAIVTNAQGTLETVPVTIGTDAEGNIVTELNTTATATTTAPADSSPLNVFLKMKPLLIGIGIVIVAVLVTIIILVIALALRKMKTNEQ